MGGAFQRILDDEKQFYESDTRDKLKVPPYNYVKRQPRDYTKENQLFSDFKTSQHGVSNLTGSKQ